MQVKKLMQSRHGTHNALKPATPNKGLFGSYRVKAIWYFTLWVVRSLAFNILVVADVQFVSITLTMDVHTLCREGGKGRSFAAAFNPST